MLAPGRDDLAADGAGVVDGAALVADPPVDLGALGVAHEGEDVTVVRVRHEGLQRRELGVVTRHVEHTDLGQPLAEEPEQPVDGASAQVVLGDLELHVVGSTAGDLAHGHDRVVGAVTRAAEPEPHRAAGRDETVGDLEQGLEARLVVGHVHDDRGPAATLEGQGVGVEPAPVVLRVGGEGAQPLDDRGSWHAEPQRGCGSGEGVGDVVVRQAGERHRHVDDADEPVGVTVLREHDHLAVEDRDRRGRHC